MGYEYGDEDPNELTSGLTRGYADPPPEVLAQAQQLASAPAAVNPAQAMPSGRNLDDAYRWPQYVAPPMPVRPDVDMDKFRDLEQKYAAPPPSHSNPALKPKWYEQVQGRAAAGLMAFGGRDPKEAVNAGSGVVNRRFNNAQSEYDTQQESLKGQLGALRDQGTAENRAYEQDMQGVNTGISSFNAASRAAGNQELARNRQAQEQQRLQGIAPGSEMPDDPKNPMGSWHATTISGKPIAMPQAPDKWLATPQAKEMIETARRQGLIKDNRLSGEDAKYVSVNGKLREPSATTNIRMPSEGNREFDAYLKSLGHPPTTQDLLTYKRGSGKTQTNGMPKSIADRIQSQKDTTFNKARQAYNGSDKTPADYEDYVNNMQAGQDDFEQRIATQTGNEDIPHTDVRSNVDAKGNWKPGAGTTPVPQSPQPQQQAPQPATPAPQPQQRAATPQPAPQRNVRTYKGHDYEQTTKNGPWTLVAKGR